MAKSRNSGSIEIGQSDQELVGSKKKRGYKKIFAFALLAAIIAAVIIVAVLLYVNEEPRPMDRAPLRLTLEDVIGGKYYPNRHNASWITSPDGTGIMYKDLEGNLILHDYDANVTKILLPYTHDLAMYGSNFKVSADGKYLMATKNSTKLFRHSSMSHFHIYDIATQTEIHELNTEHNNDYILLAEWGPVGNSIAYVYNFNIYYKANVTADTITITTDGDIRMRYGVCDWVYEEEVFGGSSALWFSPDGNNLAFIEFDDNNVHLMHIPIYGIPGVIQFQYTGALVVPYPKAGSENPIVKLFTVNLAEISSAVPVVKREIAVPTPLAATEPILTVVAWINSTQLFTVWMNRIQNSSILTSCSVSGAAVQCNDIHAISSATGWVELFKAPIFNADGTEMALILSQPQAVESDGTYRHLTILSTNENNQQRALTQGKYVVQDILKWDTETNYIFYSANTENQSHIHHVYAVKADRPQTQTPECITCGIFDEDNIEQTYFSADFSDSDHFLALSIDGPGIPRVDIYHWHINSNSSMIELAPMQEWETNDELRTTFFEKYYPPIKYTTVPLPDGFTATVKLILPTYLELAQPNQKFPMLVEVYAGPDSYSGADRWDISYGNYLASNKSIIYAQINGRGSGLRGDKLLHTIYGRLGTFEISDQRAAVRELIKEFLFIDENHIGIWGWSYGGYASAMAIAQSNDTFKCGASVAPVTDWALYDSIYTERYMSTPQLNAENYEIARLTTKPNAFRDKDFYLIHGTLDDNVHFQQAMVLARALELNDVLFKQMTYADEDHGLYGVRKHLYHSLTNYFSDCFHLASGH